MGLVAQKGGQEDQGTLKQPLVLMGFLWALAGLPGNPSSHPYLEAQKSQILMLYTEKPKSLAESLGL